MKSIAIIGSGLGGLAAAIALATAGFRVDVYEKNDYPGGKMKRYVVGGARFDFGPNTITMPHLFEQVFTDSGVHAADYLTFDKLERHTRNHFADGTILTSSSDEAYMSNELKRFGVSASDYKKYVRTITRLHKLAVNQFFDRPFASISDYTSIKLAAAFAAVRPFQSMHAFHQSFFTDKRVIQLFDRFATYVGSSPYLTPATFALIGYLEYVYGVYYVKGGNPTIAEAFYKRALELGVRFYFDEEVTALHVDEKQYVRALTTEKQAKRFYDAFLLNGDYLTVYPKLVPPSVRPSFTEEQHKKEPTSSAFVILAATSEKTSASAYHQVYFSSSYEKEFDDLFAKKRYPQDPTIYISNSSAYDASAVEKTNGDNLFILVNAPSLTGENRTFDKERWKEYVYDLLEKRGVSIRKRLIADRIITPADIEKDFNSYFGGLYGYTSHGFLQAFNRPSAKSKDIRNLFFAGGSTHPGGGSPMVVQSGRNAASLMIKQLR